MRRHHLRDNALLPRPVRTVLLRCHDDYFGRCYWRRLRQDVRWTIYIHAYSPAFEVERAVYYYALGLGRNFISSGVGTGSFPVRVMPGGRVLEVFFQWTLPTVDLKLLHKKWITPINVQECFECYHHKFLWFEAVLKEHRESVSDWVESTAYIFSLPISVQMHIQQRSNLAWFDQTARVVHIDLKAIEDNYGLIMPHDENSFELVYVLLTIIISLRF